jgi:hypothetical protein
VIEGDPVAEAIVALLADSHRWSGTAGTLLQEITPRTTPKGWPEHSRALAGHLRRLIPALRSAGIDVRPPLRTDKRRIYIIETAIKGGTGDQSRQTAPPSRAADCSEVRDDAGTWGRSGGMGGVGGHSQPSSEEEYDS